MKTSLTVLLLLSIAIFGMTSFAAADTGETYFVFPENESADTYGEAVNAAPYDHTAACMGVASPSQCSTENHQYVRDQPDASFGSAQACTCGNAPLQANADAAMTDAGETQMGGDSGDMGVGDAQIDEEAIPTAIELFGEKTLRRVKNTYVLQLQAYLNMYFESKEGGGFTRLTEDGVFTRSTENAVRKFQEEQGLIVDGRAGAETKQRLINVVHGTDS